MKWLTGEEAVMLKPTANRGIAQDADGGLYFWDETDTGAFGPYPTIAACLLGIKDYVQSLDGDA